MIQEQDNFVQQPCMTEAQYFMKKLGNQFKTITDRKNFMKAKLLSKSMDLLSKSKTIVHPNDNSIIRIMESFECVPFLERILKCSIFLDHGRNYSGEKLRWLKMSITTYTPSLRVNDRITQFGVVYIFPEKDDKPLVYEGGSHLILPREDAVTPDNHWARRVTKELFMELNAGRKIEQFVCPSTPFTSKNMRQILIESEFHKQHKDNPSISIASNAHWSTM